MASDNQYLVLEANGYLSFGSPESKQKQGLTKVLNGTCWTVPTVYRGMILIRDESRIKAFKIR